MSDVAGASFLYSDGSDDGLTYNDESRKKKLRKKRDSSADDLRRGGRDVSDDESDNDSPPTSSDEEVTSPVSGTPSWLAAQDGAIPAGAVDGASNAHGLIYVARCKVRGLWFPATLIPKQGKCYTIVNRKIHSSPEYQVLCYCRPRWIKLKNNSPPPLHSLPVDADEKLYIGRVQSQNNHYTNMGLVSIKNGVCYAIKNENIKEYDTYEILTLTQSELSAINKQGKGILNSVYNALPSFMYDNNDSDESSEVGLPSNKRGKKVEKPSTSRYDDGQRGRKSDVKDRHWVKSENDNVPAGAVMACNSKNGPIYVARIRHEGSMLPGKLIPRFEGCFVPYNGVEIKKKKYEVLCNVKPIWKAINSSSNRVLPKDALQGGWTDKKKPLYIGRVKDKFSVGLVKKNMRCCRVVYGQKEQKHSEFEILVVTQEEETSKNRVQHKKHTSRSDSDEYDSYASSSKNTKKKTSPIQLSNPSTSKKTYKNK